MHERLCTLQARVGAAQQSMLTASLSPISRCMPTEKHLKGSTQLRPAFSSSLRSRIRQQRQSHCPAAGPQGLAVIGQLMRFGSRTTAQASTLCDRRCAHHRPN